MHEVNKLEKITKILIFIAGLSQLVLSQVHIAAISKLFVREVGFYLFMFILFGIVLIPMVLSFDENHPSSFVPSLVSMLVTIGLGAFTMYLMTNSLNDPQNTATMKDLQPALLLISGAILLDGVSFVLSAIRLLGLRQGGKKHARLAGEQ